MAAVVVLGVCVALAGLATSTILIARALQSETQAKDDKAEALDRDWRVANLHCITLALQDLAAFNLGRALRLLDAHG